MMQHLVESGFNRFIRPNAVGPNDGLQTTAYTNLFGAQMAYIYVFVAEGDVANFTLRVMETDGTTPQALANGAQIWHNDDVSAADQPERQANGATLVVTGSTDDKYTIFAVDPARLSDNYHSIALQVDTTPGNAVGANQAISAHLVVLPARYKGPRT